MCLLSVFFFKQKTAYEMRISDWSSDVCSSDLATVVATESYPTGRGTENGSLVRRFAQRIGAGGTPYIDAVLLPDGGSEIRNLAPLMAYYDVDNTKVRYLGSTQWNDPELGREPALTRSEERRVGKEGVSTCRCRWSADH